MTSKQQLAEAFERIVELSTALGVANIKEMPGCWEFRVDDRYRFAVNGHPDPLYVKPDGCMGISIQPFEAAIWRNGWLAMLMNPYGGTVFGANTENEFIAAMDAAIHDAVRIKTNRLAE